MHLDLVISWLGLRTLSYWEKNANITVEMASEKHNSKHAFYSSCYWKIIAMLMEEVTRQTQ